MTIKSERADYFQPDTQVVAVENVEILLEKAVEAERERFRETNIKKLVEEMQEDAEEYGDKHDELCPCNMEYPDACDCETMKWVKAFTQEWMAKVNQMWVTNLYNHRKHCTSDGNKELTVIKKKLSARRQTTCEHCGDEVTQLRQHVSCEASVVAEAVCAFDTNDVTLTPKTDNQTEV